MTLDLLQPLQTSLIAAQRHADAWLWDEAVARFHQLDSVLCTLPLRLRRRLESRVYAMLPSDWPLWMERRRHDADTLALAAPGRVLH